MLYYARIASSTPSRKPVVPAEDVVDAVLRASRALVAVAADSLAPVEGNVTIPQFRALVVLASRGPMTAGGLASALHVHTSTLTRLCDRLVAKGLVVRNEEATNRRHVRLALTARGRSVV